MSLLGLGRPPCRLLFAPGRLMPDHNSPGGARAHQGCRARHLVRYIVSQGLCGPKLCGYKLLRACITESHAFLRPPLASRMHLFGRFWTRERSYNPCTCTNTKRWRTKNANDSKRPSPRLHTTRLPPRGYPSSQNSSVRILKQTFLMATGSVVAQMTLGICGS